MNQNALETTLDLRSDQDRSHGYQVPGSSKQLGKINSGRMNDPTMLELPSSNANIGPGGIDPRFGAYQNLQGQEQSAHLAGQENTHQKLGSPTDPQVSRNAEICSRVFVGCIELACLCLR